MPAKTKNQRGTASQVVQGPEQSANCPDPRDRVAEYLRRAGETDLAWPLPAGLDEVTLERRLFPPPRCCRPRLAVCRTGRWCTRNSGARA